jgi:hypothetical protein
VTALAVPLARRATGRHRLTWKQRLIRRNERAARELDRAQPRRQARRAAHVLIRTSSAPAYAGNGHYLAAFETAAGLLLAGLILLVVFW